MNNNKLCPSCRHPLPTNTCRRCGYKTQTLQVVDTQQEFGRQQYGSRIRKIARQGIRAKVITKEEKLSLYLREYQQLIKTVLSKLISAYQLPRDSAEQLRKQVKNLWQSFLQKKCENKSPIIGMFWKYLNNSHKVEDIKDKEVPQDDKSDGSSKEDEQVFILKRKRGRPPKSATLQAKQLSGVTQFRCYYNISVKPLLNDSQQERKQKEYQLTSAQKSFLSYLLALRVVDQSLLRVASTKYLTLILGVQGIKLDKSYIKDSVIEEQLKKRRTTVMKKRQYSIMLILLIDLLRDWTLNYGSLQTHNLLRLMLNEYERSVHKSIVLDKIIQQIRKEKKQQDLDTPNLTFQFIYSLIYVATVKVGLTLTVGEVITGCGSLSIQKISLEDDLYLSGVTNEEAISSEKIRRSSHVLASYLRLSFVTQVAHWSLKWCKKLDLLMYTSRVQMINHILFSEAKEKFNRSQKDGKSQTYRRFFQLQQDIASIAGVIILTKLSHGLTNYPFLLHANIDELDRLHRLEGNSYKILTNLLKNKELTVKKQDGSIVIRQIPELYHQYYPIFELIHRVCYLNSNDQKLGRNHFNGEIIRMRSLADINELSAARLMQWSINLKQFRKGNIKLRHGQVQHMQWINQLNRKKKNISIKTVAINNNLDGSDFSEDIKNQLSCVVGSREQLIEVETTEREICLLDEPCANYELMYDYSSDTMTLTDKQEQLFLMEGLCFNNCTFGELGGWLSHYESSLKRFENN